MEILSVASYSALFLTLLYAIVVCSFIRGWHRLVPFKYTNTQSQIPVSVIVAARNEAERISATIEDLLAQDYDSSLLEIIFIDDHSTDNTGAIINSYADRGVKLITLNEQKALNSYKKKAIQTAIGQAKGKLIITTDADCSMGRNWLKTIVAYYQAGDYKMISSPVAYTGERTLFERGQSLEFLYLIGLGASTIGNQNPSTCNGANLTYERDAFYEVGGFKGIDDLASGDDELLLHKMAARYPGKIGFLKNRDAIVYTQAKPTLRDFIQQRKRWASKSTRYKNKSIIVLGALIWLFNVSIVLNLIMGIFNPVLLGTAGLQLIVKLAVEFIFLIGVTRFAKRSELLWLVPLLSIVHIIYIIFIAIAGNSGKYSWKGRMVK
ncbi:glycosyltransferase family 2 protein [Pedobacter duraquae]|uniref:Cellulose synthase/poly-beta-1,6-N-acetylglucosamine synthase-like glycosyltransferase n=1 Tax=Pedobacter duraquae TaxID=425511 RepID=A0A4R6II33_9SPHI|nr:glycosyltransferase [Pedobacter duraquae]TDO21610.1 cellulose synthase/poly-beta-1,6-N-acetylglucosamine synthase-like glycosyltransferase [Pedobacter duraquae]